MRYLSLVVALIPLSLAQIYVREDEENPLVAFLAQRDVEYDFEDIEIATAVEQTTSPAATLPEAGRPTSTPSPTTEPSGPCGSNGVCLELVAVEPRIIPKKAGTIVTFSGSGFNDNTGLISLIAGETSIPSADISVQTLGSTHFLVWVVSDASILEGATGTVSIVVGKSDQTTATSPVQLSFFDQAISTISSVAPSRISSPLTQTVVQISGLSVYQSLIPVCVFMVDGAVISSSTPSLDRTQTIYSCVLSPSSNYSASSAKILVNILYDTPQFATPNFPNVENYLRLQYFADQSNSAFVALFAPAPQISGAQFSDNGASVAVTFDRPVQIINATVYFDSNSLDMEVLTGSIACNSVFDSNSPPFGKFEATPGDCLISVSGVSTIDINISGRFANTDLDALSVSDIVSLLNYTVAARGELYSDTASGRALIAAPANLPQPKLAVQYSSVVSDCSDITWDFSTSSTGSGRNWKTLTIAVPDYPQLEAYVATQIGSLLNGTSFVLQIPKELVVPGNYVVTIAATNFLGGSANQVLTISKSSEKFPDITVLETHTGVATSGFYAIEASYSSCHSDTVEYQWSQSTGPTINFDSSTNGSSLTIAPFAMLPGSTYVFELRAGFVGLESNTYTITVTTAVDTISATAGSSQKVSTTSKISLSPVIVNEAYATPLDISRFVCTWSCTDSASAACQDLSGGELSLASTSCDPLDLTGKLGAGEYVFGISVANTDTGSTATGQSSYISVVEAVIPIVRMIPTSANPGRNSPSFVINTDVDPTTVQNIDNVIYTWSSQASCNGNSYSVISLEKGVTTETDPSRDPSLSFKANALTPKAVYCFQVKVYEEINPDATGIASVIITVRDIPSGGICEIAGSTTLKSFTDIMTIRCPGWTTDPKSNPVKYEFSVRTSTSTSYLTLQSLSSKFLFSILTVLPAGEYVARVKIQDNAFSTSNSEQIIPFTVTAQTVVDKRGLYKRDDSSSFESIRSYIKNSTVDFSSSKVIGDAIRDVGIGALALPDNIASSVGGSALQEELVAYISDIVNAGWILDPSSNAPQASSILVGLLGDSANWDIPKALAETLYDLTGLIVENANGLVSTNCYDYATGSGFKTVYDAVLTSATSNNIYSSKFANVHTALESINVCQYTGMVCGQSPFEYDGISIDETAGILLATSTQTYCSGFEVSSGSTICTRYVCSEIAGGSIVAAGIATSAGVTDVGKKIGSLSLSNDATSAAIISTSVKWTTNLDTSLISNYRLNSVSSDHEVNVAKLNSDFTDIVKPSGDNLVGYTGSSFTFSPLSTGKFIAFVELAPSTTKLPDGTNTPYIDTPNTDTNTGGSNAAIVGGAVGGGVAVILVGALVFFLVRKRKAADGAAAGGGNPHNMVEGGNSDYQPV